MSHDTKYEYQLNYFEGYRGNEVVEQTQRQITYMTGEGWALHQINPSVVSVDNGIGSLMAMHSAFLTFRRPME